MKQLEQKINIDELIRGYVTKYASTKKPIEVSFRDLLPNLNKTDRYTHLIHTYPAKLLLHIPYFFLNNNLLTKKGDLILDPFCGTGTVLLEAMLAGRKAIGADANPLARLIAEVKTTKYDVELLRNELEKLLKRSNKKKAAPIPEVVNKDFWFSKNNQRKLSVIRQSIDEISDERVKNFFLVCFSNCIKKVSYADPRISVPVKLNPTRFRKGSVKHENIVRRLQSLEKLNVKEKFKSICVENIGRIEKTGNLINGHSYVKVSSKDARHLRKAANRKLESNSVKMVITSPPYAGAQKYIRSSSLNLGWLGMATINELRTLDSKNIGRENYKNGEAVIKVTGISIADSLISKVEKINRKRAIIISNYLLEMKDALSESIRVIKKGGYLVLIVGNNQVCGKEFNTQAYLSEYLQENGLKLEFKLIDDIKSYGLMTKRNKTADIISREWILVFKKVRK